LQGVEAHRRLILVRTIRRFENRQPPKCSISGRNAPNWARRSWIKTLSVSALAQDQVSHYDPKTNRCYVELDVHQADLTRLDEYSARYLHDGQTGEILAWSQSKNGVQTGFVSGALGLNSDASTANAKIDDLMADDRKR